MRELESSDIEKAFELLRSYAWKQAHDLSISKWIKTIEVVNVNAGLVNYELDLSIPIDLSSLKKLMKFNFNPGDYIKHCGEIKVSMRKAMEPTAIPDELAEIWFDYLDKGYNNSGARKLACRLYNQTAKEEEQIILSSLPAVMDISADEKKKKKKRKVS